MADSGLLTDWFRDYMKSQPQAKTYTAAQAGTTDWTVGKDQTVQGQLDGILAKDGVLMQRAATRSAQEVNGRGLLNSSIGIGAGQSALYDAATPIATTDAGTYAAAGQFNADSKNKASIANASFTNDASRFGADAGNKALEQWRSAGIGGEDRAHQSAMQTAGFNQQKDLQAADFTQQSKTQAADLGSRYELARLDVESRSQLQKADAENQQKLQAANAVLQTGLQTSDLSVKESMQKYASAVQMAMQDKDNGTKLQLATLDADSRTALANIEAAYKTKLQTSSSMASSYQSMVDGITRIMADPNMDATSKQTAIGNLTTLYNNALKMQENVSGLRLGTLLDPGSFGGTPGGTYGGGNTQPGGPTNPMQDWRDNGGGG